jgi:HEAT repeats
MRRLLLAGCLMAALVSPAAQVTLPAVPVNAEMPAYQGRTLESWLKDLRCTPCGPEHDPAANAIRQMGARALPYLLQVIARGDTEEAYLAAHAIREIGSLATPAIPVLKGLLAQEKSSFVAAEALVVLSQRSVIQALSDPRPKIRQSAVLALGYAGPRVDASAVPPLVTMLDAGGAGVDRSYLAWALGSIAKGADQAVPALLRLLADNDPWLRQTAAGLLGNFKLERTRPRLVAALTDLHAGVRAAAARSLGGAVDRQTDDVAVQTIVTALAATLKDPDDNVRAQSAWALGAIGPRAIAVVPALLELLNDSTQGVRQTAVASLAHINGR